MLKQLLLAVLFFCSVPQYAQQPSPAKHSNVRAITAFIHLDREHYQAQLEESFAFLRTAKQSYTAAGWTVQTVRLTTQPFPEYTRGLSKADAVSLLTAIDSICDKAGVDLNIGPAVMNSSDSTQNLVVLGEVLLHAKRANASALVATAEGINWPAIKATAHMIKYVSENSPRSQGTFNFAATFMVQPGTPFYPGSYHLGAGHQFAVGVEGAGVVASVFAKTGYDPAASTTLLHAALEQELTQAESVAKQIATQDHWDYIGIDSTPAPLMDVSIGAAIENFAGGPLGAGGTMTAAGIITEAQKGIAIKRIGYAGLMLPVLEDKRIAQRWTEGRLSIDSLLAYSSVCATGLDTVPLPGDVTEEQIAHIYGDVATLAFKWKKQLTARLQPVAGKHAGEMTDFDSPYLVNVKLQPVP